MDKYLALLVLMFATSLSVADSRKTLTLFKELPEAKKQLLRERNFPELEEHLYFSSRYDILESKQNLIKRISVGDKIVLNAFSDASYTLTVEKIEDNGDFSYIDAYVDVDFPTKEQFENSEKPEDLQYEKFRRSLIGVTIQLVGWDVEANTGEAFMSFKNEGIGLGSGIEPPKEGRREKRSFSRKKFQGLETDLHDAQTNRTFVIRMLPFNPKYSYVYEVDPEKSYVPRADAVKGDEARKNTDNERKRERHAQFLKAFEEERSSEDNKKAIKEDI